MRLRNMPASPNYNGAIPTLNDQSGGNMTGNPTKNQNSKPVRQKYTSPLDQIEFDNASDVIKYGNTMRAYGRHLQMELHTAAEELQAILSASGGNVYQRAQARRKAKKVAN